MCHPHLPCSSLTTAALNVIQCMRTDRGVKGLADRLLALMEMNVCVCGGALKGKECGSPGRRTACCASYYVCPMTSVAFE